MSLLGEAISAIKQRVGEKPSVHRGSLFLENSGSLRGTGVISKPFPRQGSLRAGRIWEGPPQARQGVPVPLCSLRVLPETSASRGHRSQWLRPTPTTPPPPRGQNSSIMLALQPLTVSQLKCFYHSSYTVSSFRFTPILGKKCVVYKLISDYPPLSLD